MKLKREKNHTIMWAHECYLTNFKFLGFYIKNMDILIFMMVFTTNLRPISINK